jgi:hypothetical protein
MQNQIIALVDNLCSQFKSANFSIPDSWNDWLDFIQIFLVIVRPFVSASYQGKIDEILIAISILKNS